MNDLTGLKQAFEEATTLALATTINNIPNVRIVNFVWDEQNPNIIFFTSDRSNQKVTEFTQNAQVAFTTIPRNQNASVHARSQHATVQKSSQSLGDIKDLFVAKTPAFAEAITFIGEQLDVFEIVAEKILVTADFDNTTVISFT